MHPYAAGIMDTDRRCQAAAMKARDGVAGKRDGNV